MIEIKHPISGPRVYDAVNICIYCGSKVNLSDEHIIPYGLQGNWILPKSSCAKCRDITSAFEGRLLRGVFLPARVSAGYQTRRPQERPQKFPVTIISDGQEKEVLVPIENHPALIPLPILETAACKTNRPYEKGLTIVGQETIKFGIDPEKTGKIVGADELSLSLVFRPVDFARMVAKIAYSFVCAEFRRSSFEEVFVLPAILGEKDDVGRWVGSDDYLFKPENKGALHILAATVANAVQNGSTIRIAVIKVKLFANSGVGGYEVFVGRLRN